MDIQFATKEACRDMAHPTIASWRKVKRLARDLLEYPWGEWEFAADGGKQVESHELQMHSDSGWAGRRGTRRSTSGGVMSVQGAAINVWSGTQAFVAMSSGEAEYSACTRAAAGGLCLQAVARDLEWTFRAIVHAGMSAAKAVAS